MDLITAHFHTPTLLAALALSDAIMAGVCWFAFLKTTRVELLPWAGGLLAQAFAAVDSSPVVRLEEGPRRLARHGKRVSAPRHARPRAGCVVHRPKQGVTPVVRGEQP